MAYSYVGESFKVHYIAPQNTSGLLDVIYYVRKPNGIVQGPYAMSELTSPFQGVYAGDYLDSDIEGTYLFKVIVSSISKQDTRQIQMVKRVWDHITSSYNDVNTFGESNQKAVPSENIDDYKADVTGLESDLAIIKGLSGHNQRLKNVVLNGEGNLLSADKYIYPTDLDFNNDTNAINKYIITVTYDLDDSTILTYSCERENP